MQVNLRSGSRPDSSATSRFYEKHPCKDSPDLESSIPSSARLGENDIRPLILEDTHWPALTRGAAAVSSSTWPEFFLQRADQEN